ncbi:hypothetical protein E4U47_000207, partial [Claviceps purpurea]
MSDWPAPARASIMKHASIAVSNPNYPHFNHRMDALDLVAHVKAGEGIQSIVRQPRQLIEDSSRDIVFLFLDT